MAKKKTKAKNDLLTGVILGGFGAVMLLLALIPATSSTGTFLSATTTENQSFWAMFFDIFTNGFGEGAIVGLKLCSILYLFVSAVSLFVGVLAFLKVIKISRLDWILYAVTFVALLVFMILFLTGDPASFVIEGLTSYKTTTWVYVPLAVSTIALAYKTYELVKNK